MDKCGCCGMEDKKKHAVKKDLHGEKKMKVAKKVEKKHARGD